MCGFKWALLINRVGLLVSQNGHLIHTSYLDNNKLVHQFKSVCLVLVIWWNNQYHPLSQSSCHNIRQSKQRLIAPKSQSILLIRQCKTSILRWPCTITCAARTPCRVTQDGPVTKSASSDQTNPINRMREWRINIKHFIKSVILTAKCTFGR